jgi:hypothetical protein
VTAISTQRRAGSGRRLLAAFLLAAAVAGSVSAVVYPMLKPEDHPVQDLSALGRRVYEADREKWVCARSAHVAGYGRGLADVDEALQEAEFALADIGRRLVLPEPDGLLHLFLVRDDATWQDLARRNGFRPDSLAVHYRHEIFLRDDLAQKPRADRISHEIIHYRLQHAMPARVPLWVDEGLAGYFGVKVAAAYREQRDRRLTVEVPAIPADDLLTLDQLTSLTALPASPAQARAFYRQAEEFFAELGWQFGDERIAPFVHRVGEGENWRRVLEGGYGLTPARIEEIERAVRQRATTARSL